MTPREAADAATEATAKPDTWGGVRDVTIPVMGRISRALGRDRFRRAYRKTGEGTRRAVGVLSDQVNLAAMPSTLTYRGPV